MRIYDIIGDIDERAEFWHADTMYGEQLKAFEVKHILVEGSVVHHLERGSNTLETLSKTQQEKLTTHSPVHRQIYSL